MSTDIPMDRAGTLLECLCLLKIRCAWNDQQIALCLSYTFPSMLIVAEDVEKLFREALRHRHTWLQKMRQEFQDDETSETMDFATDFLEGHSAGRGILKRTERISREDARKIFPLMQHQPRIFPEYYPRGFNVVDYLMSVIRGHPYEFSPVTRTSVNDRARLV